MVQHTLEGLSVSVSHIDTPIERLALDVPVLGKVVGYRRLTSLTRAGQPQQEHSDFRERVLSAFPQVAENRLLSLDHAELVIPDINPGAELEYVIKVEGRPEGTVFAGDDRLLVSYSWLVGGNRQIQEKYVAFRTGETVEPPAMQVEDLMIYNGGNNVRRTLGR